MSQSEMSNYFRKKPRLLADKILMKVRAISKFKLLRHQKRAQRFFKNYHIAITFTAMMFLAFSNLDVGGDLTNTQRDRMPASLYSKDYHQAAPKQVIEIKTSYEKISSVGILHISSVISSQFLSAENVHYEWKKLENAQIISGNLEGDLDMSEEAQEVGLDIAIKDPKLPAQISIEASALSNGTKYDSEKRVILRAEKTLN